MVCQNCVLQANGIAASLLDPKSSAHGWTKWACVPNAAILGVADATLYSIHVSPRGRYIFEAGCNAETQKRRLNWAFDRGVRAQYAPVALCARGCTPRLGKPALLGLSIT